MQPRTINHNRLQMSTPYLPISPPHQYPLTNHSTSMLDFHPKDSLLHDLKIPDSVANSITTTFQRPLHQQTFAQPITTYVSSNANQANEYPAQQLTNQSSLMFSSPNFPNLQITPNAPLTTGTLNFSIQSNTIQSSFPRTNQSHHLLQQVPTLSSSPFQLTSPTSLVLGHTMNSASYGLSNNTNNTSNTNHTNNINNINNFNNINNINSTTHSQTPMQCTSLQSGPFNPMSTSSSGLSSQFSLQNNTPSGTTHPNPQAFLNYRDFSQAQQQQPLNPQTFQHYNCGTLLPSNSHLQPCFQGSNMQPLTHSIQVFNSSLPTSKQDSPHGVPNRLMTAVTPNSTTVTLKIPPQISSTGIEHLPRAVSQFGAQFPLRNNFLSSAGNPSILPTSSNHTSSLLQPSHSSNNLLINQKMYASNSGSSHPVLSNHSVNNAFGTNTNTNTNTLNHITPQSNMTGITNNITSYPSNSLGSLPAPLINFTNNGIFNQHIHFSGSQLTQDSRPSSAMGNSKHNTAAGNLCVIHNAAAHTSSLQPNSVQSSSQNSSHHSNRDSALDASTQPKLPMSNSSSNLPQNAFFAGSNSMLVDSSSKFQQLVPNYTHTQQTSNIISPLSASVSLPAHGASTGSTMVSNFNQPLVSTQQYPLMGMQDHVPSSTTLSNSTSTSLSTTGLGLNPTRQLINHAISNTRLSRPVGQFGAQHSNFESANDHYPQPTITTTTSTSTHSHHGASSNQLDFEHSTPLQNQFKSIPSLQSSNFQYNPAKPPTTDNSFHQTLQQPQHIQQTQQTNLFKKRLSNKKKPDLTGPREFNSDELALLYESAINGIDHRAQFKKAREELATQLSEVSNRPVTEAKIRRWFLHLNNKINLYIENGKRSKSRTSTDGVDINYLIDILAKQRLAVTGQIVISNEDLVGDIGDQLLRDKRGDEDYLLNLPTRTTRHQLRRGTATDTILPDNELLDDQHHKTTATTTTTTTTATTNSNQYDYSLQHQPSFQSNTHQQHQNGMNEVYVDYDEDDDDYYA